jgi:hypothetical protein
MPSSSSSDHSYKNIIYSIKNQLLLLIILVVVVVYSKND